MERSISIEQVDLFIESSRLEEGAIKIVKRVKSHWNEDEIQIKIFTDGITNRLIGCYLPDNEDDMVLTRVYGEKTELFIDRKLEVRNMRLMHKAGLTPPLYCTFENGLCYGYAVGNVLDEDMVRDAIISRIIAERLAKMHTIRPLFSKKNANSAIIFHTQIEQPEPSLFRGMQKFLDLMPCAFDNPEKDQR